MFLSFFIVFFHDFFFLLLFCFFIFLFFYFCSFMFPSIIFVPLCSPSIIFVPLFLSLSFPFCSFLLVSFIPLVLFHLLLRFFGYSVSLITFLFLNLHFIVVPIFYQYIPFLHFNSS